MKFLSYLSAAVFAVQSLIAADTPQTQSTNKQDTNNETPIDISKVSEAFGNFIGRTLNNPSIGIKFDIDAVVKGIKNGYEGKPSPLSEKEYEEAIMTLQERGIARLADENMKKADDFMKDNAKATSVVQIEPLKLQYIILQQGTGPKVDEHGSPLIAYTGKFQDGTVFGSSDESGPIRINLDRTIPGFSKGIVGMRQGEKRRLFIHPDLAYGTKGELSPNALLIFDVEVISASEPASPSEEKSQEKVEMKK